jgi:hypothetical protein
MSLPSQGAAAPRARNVNTKHLVAIGRTTQSFVVICGQALAERTGYQSSAVIKA